MMFFENLQLDGIDLSIRVKMASPHVKIDSDGFNIASTQPQFHRKFTRFVIPCMSNLLCYRLIHFKPIKNKSFIDVRL